MNCFSIDSRRFCLGLTGLQFLFLGLMSVLHVGGAEAQTSDLKNTISNLITSKGQLALSDLDDFLSKLSIPQAAQSLFQTVSITKPILGLAPKGYTGFSIAGSVLFNKQEVGITVNVMDVDAGRIYSVALATYAGWKFTDMFPELSSALIDKISLPELQLIVSSADYVDQNLGVTIYKGLNLISSLELSGPFALFNTFVKNKTQLPDAFSFDEGKLSFQGVIDPNFSKSWFSATIPFKISLDFTKIKKMPQSVTDIITKVSTGDFTVTVAPPPTPSIKLATGLEITLATQAQVLKPRLSVTISDTVLTGAASLDSTLNLAWFTLSQVALQMEWDETLIEAALVLGIPFTGIGLRGTFYLGKEGDSRVAIDIAALARVQAGGTFGDLMFEGSAQNLKISDFIAYLVKLGGLQIPSGKIPDIAINKLGIYVVPVDTWIASKMYRAGLGVSADMTVLGFNGGLSFQINPQLKTIEAQGHMSDIQGKVLQITGVGTSGTYGATGEQVTYKGPEVKVTLSGTAPEKSGFTAHGKLNIPAINLSETVDLDFSSQAGLQGTFETKVGNLFDIDMNLSLNPQSLDDFNIAFSFTKDNQNSFAKLVTNGIAQAASKINTTVTNLQEQSHNCYCARPLKAKEQACKDAKYTKHVAKCLGNTVENIAKKLAVFPQALLSTLDSLIDALNAVQLTAVSGEIKGSDLAQGKLPTMSLEFYIAPLKKTVSIKSFPFDFKNPGTSIKNIAKKFIEAFK